MLRAISLGAALAVFAAGSGFAQSASVSTSSGGDGNCKINNTAGGAAGSASGPGAMSGTARAGSSSTSVTVGGGQASAETSGTGGLSVTVRSADGKSSGTVTAPPGGRVVVTASGQSDCEITVSK